MERQEQKRIQDAKDREAKSRRKYEVKSLLSCAICCPVPLAVFVPGATCCLLTFVVLDLLPSPAFAILCHVLSCAISYLVSFAVMCFFLSSANCGNCRC